MRDATKLISLLFSPVGRDWERSELSPYRWRAVKTVLHSIVDREKLQALRCEFSAKYCK